MTKGCNPPTNDAFCPGEYVTRQQMASFLVRALGLSTWQPSLDHSIQPGIRFNLTEVATSAGYAAAATADLNDDVLEECVFATQLPVSPDGYWVQHGWALGEWSTLTSQEQADAREELEASVFRLTLNGADLDVFDTFIHNEDFDEYGRIFQFVFPGWLQGTHRIGGERVDRNGIVEIRMDATVKFSG